MRIARTAASRLAATLALIALLPSIATGAETARSTLDGVYTERQAQDGRRIHEEHCARCHEPSFYRGAFLAGWQSVPLALLYDTIEMKMPEDAPGSLAPEQYASVLAYVLELNGLPAGRRPLSHERAELAAIRIERGD